MGSFSAGLGGLVRIVEGAGAKLSSDASLLAGLVLDWGLESSGAGLLDTAFGIWGWAIMGGSRRGGTGLGRTGRKPYDNLGHATLGSSSLTWEPI